MSYSLLTLSLLAVASFFTSALSATIGMAGGIVLLSIMTFFLPLNVIVPVHGLVQLVSNSYRSFLLRKNIVWEIFLYFTLGLPFGVVLTVFLIKKLDNPMLPLILIGILILYTIFRPKRLPHIQIPFWAFCFVGFMVGLLGPLIGATGPTMAMFFLRDDLNKKEIVATKSSVQTVGHLVKVPAFLYLGFNYGEHLWPIVLMIIFTFIGTRVGVHLLGKIRDNHFRMIFKVALFFAALRVLYKAFTL